MMPEPHQDVEISQTEIEVKHGVGLHARPSVTFTRLAKSFPCAIEIEVDGNSLWLNGKSIVKIMGAKFAKDRH